MTPRRHDHLSRLEDRIDALSGAILDGQRIDWDEEIRKAVDAEQAQAIQNLQLLATVYEAHRQVRFGSHDKLPFLQWRHLQLLSPIASGNHGDLFRAWDETLGQEVALKLFRSTTRDRGQRSQVLEEARRLAKVRHENVVRVYGADVDHQHVGFWMEYVNGDSLSSILEQHGQMDEGEIARVGIAVSRALAAAHAVGVLHGDIKTANVLCEAEGRIVLVDFGSGRTLLDGFDLARWRSGTPLYMAPETILEEQLTEASDIYGLGVLLFNLSTLRYPVEGNDLDDLANKHRAGKRIALVKLRPDLSDEFRVAVERCLATLPQDRFEKAADIEKALADFIIPPGEITTNPINHGMRPHLKERDARSGFLKRLLGLQGIVVTFVAIVGVIVAWQVFSGSAIETPARAALIESTFKIGVQAYKNRDFDTARTCFKDVVGYDSTHAMAYYRWSQCEAFWDEGPLAQNLARSAYENSEHLEAEERDRVRSWYWLLADKPDEAVRILQARAQRHPKNAEYWYELGRMYWYHLGQPRSAINNYLRAIQIDPDFGPAYNDMAYCYNSIGQSDSALACARRNVELYPQEPNPYDTLGDIARTLEPDSAAVYYHRALAAKSNFIIARDKLARMALLDGRISEARKGFNVLIRSDDFIYRAMGREHLAGVLVFEGRSQDALREIALGIEADLRDEVRNRDLAGMHALRSAVLRERGELKESLSEIEQALKMMVGGYAVAPHHHAMYKMQLLLDLGRISAAHSYVDSLETIHFANPGWLYPTLASKAMLALHQGRGDEAVRLFTEAIETEQRGIFELQYYHALAEMRRNNWEVGIEELKDTLGKYPTTMTKNPVLAVKSWFQLGIAYEAIALQHEAVEAYSRFLEYWGDCDFSSTEVEHAREVVRQASS